MGGNKTDESISSERVDHLYFGWDAFQKGIRVEVTALFQAAS